MALKIKLKHELVGQHRHITVFLGPKGGSLGESGVLYLREEHFQELLKILKQAAFGNGISGFLFNGEDLEIESQEILTPGRGEE